MIAESNPRDSRLRGGFVRSLVVGAQLLLVPVALSYAQNAPPPASQRRTSADQLSQGRVSERVLAAIEGARARLEAGNGNSARNTMDSLVAVLGSAAPSSPVERTADLVEALYWRSAMAETLQEAERDWRRLIVEAPLNPRAANALLRLSELEALRGNSESSRQYAERVILEHSASPERIKAELLVAKSWLAEKNKENACAALATLPQADLVGEPKLQLDEMRRECNGAAEAKPQAQVPTQAQAQALPPERDAKFSVQLAAYARKADADAMVKRLLAMSIEARVDGTENPFRVRVGYFRTRAEANAVLQSYIKRGLTGFVAELKP